MYTAVIQGTGSYLPSGRLTNADLERMVVTSDEWIVSHTGIRERAVADRGEATSDLAYQAAKRALAAAGLAAERLDMIIVATETPDHLFPPVACRLQHLLGCRSIAAYDLHLVCTGFVAALHTAEMYLKLGRYEHILVVGADILTRITDYTDRTSCILFADGAGAVVLSRGERVREDAIHRGPGIGGDTSRSGEAGGGDKSLELGGGIERRGGILHSELFADGSHYEAAIVPGGGSRYPDADGEGRKPKIVQDGHSIFRLAVRGMSQTVKHSLSVAGLEAEQLDWLIPHQANQRIMDAVAEQLSFPSERMISTISHIGNNSAATIPIALDIAVRGGRIRRGQHVMLTAFGGGVAWGSVLLQY